MSVLCSGEAAVFEFAGWQFVEMLHGGIGPSCLSSGTCADFSFSEKTGEEAGEQIKNQRNTQSTEPSLPGFPSPAGWQRAAEETAKPEALCGGKIPLF
jgi:hypothetical protein